MNYSTVDNMHEFYLFVSCYEAWILKIHVHEEFNKLFDYLILSIYTGLM